MLTLPIRRMGNSLGIIIPKAFLEALDLRESSKIGLELEGNHLVLTPIRTKYTLEEIVSLMTPENTHPEISTGHAVGEENIEGDDNESE